MWRSTLCLLCELPLTLSHHGICHQCICNITVLPVCCLRCGLPVPLHKTRYWKRRFNQTQLLAKPLAHWLNCEYAENLLIRIKPALEQKILNARARHSNIRSAFQCNQYLAGKHIMLVDDIVTAGSTINEISHVLKQQDAGSIQIICLCRTL